MAERICESCGATYTPHRKSRATRFCTTSCNKKTRAKNWQARFWSKVDKSGPLHPTLGTRCWVWIASRHAQWGYGQFGMGSRTDGSRHIGRAHRISWEIANGPIGDGLLVLHKCDTPACVNPQHLFLGTDGDNNRDRASKGRSGGHKIAGERNVWAKLTEDGVRRIRSMHASGKPAHEIALEFGVGTSCIFKVLSRETWGHVGLNIGGTNG